MKYKVFAFRQNDNAPVQLLMVTTSSDIDSWAKVPTRLSRSPSGFQRAQLRSHVDDIKTFFNDDPTKTNSSPTSVLIGVEPDESPLFTLHDVDTELPIELSSIQRIPTLCTLNVEFEPWDPSLYESQEGEILALFTRVQNRIEDAIAEENEEEEEDLIDDAEEETSDSDEEFTTAEEDEEIELVAGAKAKDEAEEDVEEKQFLHLSLKEIHQACTDGSYSSWSNAKRDDLYAFLRDETKPGLIIDGQHRISATRSLPDIPFAVSLLPNASWAELAFQFIVNNSSAKKVDENLLFAIVGQSLDPVQLAGIEGRLNRAGIKVSLIKASMRVQLEDNPFSGMLKTNTPGERGFIDAAAMQRKVIEPWFGSRGSNGLKPTLKRLQAIKDPASPSVPHNMFDLFGANCNGEDDNAKKEDWQSNIWFKYFSAFWEVIRERYVVDALWPPSQDQWPSVNAVGGPKATPEQQRVQRLMGATILSLLQTAVLQHWADTRLNKMDYDIAAMRTTPIAVSEFKLQIAKSLLPLSADFFDSYKITGPDASKEVRQNFVLEALNVLGKKKTVAQVRSSNQFWQ